MGADVVIELPVAFSSQPAEWFAFGAVSALHATGVVDVLCFGSESGNIEQLSDAAKRLANEPERLKIQLKHHLKLGMNYPAAYAKAAQSVLSASEHHDTYEEPLTAEDLAKPNNTLGLHYLIALHKLQSPIKPLTITRTKAGYNDKTATDAHIASATAIRTRLLEERRLEGAAAYMPSYTREILQREWQAGRAPVDWERLALPLYYALLRSSPDELVQIAEVSEGLEHRLLRAAASITDQWSVEQLIAALKTKRYTRTKLQRVLTRRARSSQGYAGQAHPKPRRPLLASAWLHADRQNTAKAHEEACVRADHYECRPASRPASNARYSSNQHLFVSLSARPFTRGPARLL